MATKKKAAGAATKARSSSTRKKKASASKSGATATRSTTGRKKVASKKAGGDAAAAVPGGVVVVEREIGGRTLSLETGRMAKLSDGAVVARYGDTMVLACVNSSKAPDHFDFFPLTVDYREKTSAAGVIPGGFFKREGRPNTKEILTCRIIDRSIRPMFPDGFRRDVQVLSQVLATDRENDPDVVAAIASFASVALSSLPHGRSLGMTRIGCVDGKLVVNPTWTQVQSDDNKLNLTVAGHEDAIVMVEAGAKEVSEETMLEALELGHKICAEIVDMVEELREKAGKPKMEFDAPVADTKLESAIEKKFGKLLAAAPVTPGPKQVRAAAIKAAKEEVMAAFPAADDLDRDGKAAWDKKVANIVGAKVKQAERSSILKHGVRADGRDTETVRPITIEVGVLPRVHGSVLFTRGETQALGVVTLGGTEDQQIIDGLMPEPKKRFLLHYSFPPFSVGETKRMLAPGRREIGHGALAERGLEPLLPGKEEFPYTIRVTSEILESNGSSSMASACAGTLAMMDAGVPIKQPVAGIAMGLIMEGKDYAVLSDILGSEDGCGDMDFKVVGTGRGITALQMDIKCDGLTREILSEALDQAREGRLHILREMLKALRAPRKALSPNAPRLESVQIPSEKIGLIIGPGGKNIRAMQEEYEVKISIEDSGMCTVTGVIGEKVDACLEHIKAMTAEIELGAIYEGKVTAIKEFGAFVEILPGQEGLVHVSELSNEFIRAVTDVVRIGDDVKVKVIAIDDFGKVKLSRKALLEGADDAAPADEGGAREERRPRRERSERRGRYDDDRDEPRARRDREDVEEGDDRGRRPRRERRPEWRDGDGESSPRGGRGRGRHEEREPRESREPREPREPREEYDDRPARPRRGRRDERDAELEPGDEPRRARPARRDRDDDVEEVRDDRGRRRGGRRDRDDEREPLEAPRGRGPRRGRDDDDRPRRSRDDDERPRRSRDDEDDDRPRRGRARRDEPRPARDRDDAGDGGRGRRRRSEMPMAEFDDAEEAAPKAAEFDGELESIDSVIGDEPERDDRRPRRRRRRSSRD